MILTREELRGFVFDATSSAWTLAALGLALESGLFALLSEPRTLEDLAARTPDLPPAQVARVVELLASVGLVAREQGLFRLAEGAAHSLQYPAKDALAGDVRSALMQATAFLDTAARPQAGWSHTNADLLRAQGASSAGFAPVFATQIVPQLGDLGARLGRPGARFLDVGVGVAALAIAMCRAWPMLSVVGIDPFEVPLGLAKTAIAEAKLADRIELRCMGVEALTEEGSFDLAWLPVVFVPAAALPKALARMTASLRHGGWLLAAVVGEAGDERARASWRLINEVWGGACARAEDVERELAGVGLTDVRTIVGPPWAPCLVVGRKQG